MTAISSLSSPITAPARSPSPVSPRSEAPPVQRTPPSTIVKLSPEGLSASASGRAVLRWESAAQDGLSALMASNMASRSVAGRFDGLGAALLGQFRGDAANVSQSVQLAPAGAPSSPYGIAAAMPAMHGFGEDRMSLTIVTKTGVEVTLGLDNQEDGLALRMNASGELSEAERGALAGLAAAFQEAIDGMTQEPPSVRLEGLTQFNSAVLASVDLRAAIKQRTDPEGTQSLHFKADHAGRTVSLDGPSGSASVRVDTGNLSNLGSADQQARALANHLKQIDQAAGRGRADAGLMSMFKEAFSALNSNVGAVQARPGVAVAGKWELAAEDHAVLSGLADFSASVSQASGAINPMRPTEMDSFAYDLSQSTSIGGRSQGERTVSQQQKSELNASFHTPSVPGTTLRLGYDRESQNYDYHQIKDAASSDVDLAYSDGHLVKATLNQSATQSARVMSYIMGDLVSDTVTPGQQSLQRDLLAVLAPYLSGQTGLNEQQKDDQRQQLWSSLGEQVLLKGYP
ncbi:hypothetical protein HF313_16705 [Massilia atriviolacea]|uniref:Lactate dehydrogenase n=1 Tax=Massilia atriviolacea TaxID=2495579 RepID=A0A430HU38_9BURK|nr:hypothetical protein [Massilia atriviolacea]RSZ61057.1 hypothetical protein EJB06_02715 [Massilia atriviolacea]